jgi:hypothetical protein
MKDGDSVDVVGDDMAVPFGAGGRVLVRTTVKVGGNYELMKIARSCATAPATTARTRSARMTPGMSVMLLSRCLT